MASLLEFREAYSSIAVRRFQITGVHGQPEPGTPGHGRDQRLLLAFVHPPQRTRPSRSRDIVPKMGTMQVVANKASITFVTLLDEAF
jgi:hypothetical protein